MDQNKNPNKPEQIPTNPNQSELPSQLRLDPQGPDLDATVVFDRYGGVDDAVCFLLHRRNFGEAVENLTGSGEYHWMAGNFLKYGTAESTFGSKNAGDIPVDSPTKFDFIINLKAAKQIGLAIPPNVLASADRVIK